MREVSAQALALIFRIADGARISRQTVYDAFRADAKTDRLDWEDFTRGMIWLRETIGDDQTLQDSAAANFAEETAHRGQVAAMRLFASPRAVYWAMHKWGGHSLFANVSTQFEVLGPSRLRLRITADRDAPHAFFVLCGGSFRACPSVIGYPESAVRMEIAARHCDYFVDHAVSRSLFARFWSLVRAFGSRRVVLQEFEAQKLALTAQLSELNLAHRQSVEALAMMTRFLGTVTHELRTPLAGIIGIADIVRDNPLSPAEQAALVADLRGSASRLLKIVNDVVDLDASTAHDTAPRHRDVRLMIQGLVQPFIATAQAKSIPLDVVIDPGVPSYVLLESGLLSKALAPIIDNAVRFTEAGRIQIRVSVGARSTSSLVVRVSDTGPGVPAALQHRIFEPFFQIDQRLTRAHGGVGLGLAVARQLARSVDGDLRIDSSEIGSVFALEWPFKSGDAAQVTIDLPVEVAAPVPVVLPETSPAAPSAEVRKASGHRRRALVVEDNMVNQRILTKILSTLDVDSDVAADGEIAVREHAKRRYDVIFMDIQMPVMDGIQATAAIRKIESNTRHTPIVGVTANSEREFQDRAMAAGMDHFIPKPIQRTVIAEALSRISSDLN